MSDLVEDCHGPKVDLRKSKICSLKTRELKKMKLKERGKGRVASTHKFDSIAMGICADDVNHTRSVVQARLVHIGTARLTLWLDRIDTSETGNSYCLQGLMVRSFNRASYLTTQKTGFIASL